MCSLAIQSRWVNQIDQYAASSAIATTSMTITTRLMGRSKQAARSDARPAGKGSGVVLGEVRSVVAAVVAAVVVRRRHRRGGRAAVVVARLRP